MNKAILILVSFLGTVTLISCKNKSNADNITNGTIEYKIRYLNEHLNEKEASLLPKTMKLVFNEDQAINYIDGFLGLYKLNTITNFNSKKCSTLLKIFDKHYLYEGKKEEFMCCFDQMEDMQIRETGETRVIAGLNCKHASIILPSNDLQFDVYYTTDINLRHPNMTNPYNKIEGVLMQFELRLLHLRMEFTAVNFQSHTEKNSKFSIPKDAVKVTREQMIQILNKLME